MYNVNVNVNMINKQTVDNIKLKVTQSFFIIDLYDCSIYIYIYIYIYIHSLKYRGSKSGRF